MVSKTYLITGANRGIGKGFVAQFLQQPSDIVVAALRDVSEESSKSLATLPKGHGSKLILVKIDSTIDEDAAAAVDILQNKHGITSLNVVIANAGIFHPGTSVLQSSMNSLRDQVQVNTVGPLALLQATASLLKASTQPIFVVLSAFLGSISAQDMFAGLPTALSPYAGTKAAVNWFLRRLHYEETWLISFPIHPGLVSTDMATAFFGHAGLKPSDMGVVSIEESVNGMLSVINSATRAQSGNFQSYDGNVLPW